MNPIPAFGRPAAFIERLAWLDKCGAAVRPIADALSAGSTGRLLRGEPLGHTIHPALTDLPIGFWTSAVTLDVLRGRAARGDVMLLLGLGVMSAVPTALTGLAEWQTTSAPDSRVGTVHAVGNATGLLSFVAALGAHRRGARSRAIVWELVGSTAATAAGLLGGHLTAVRHVGTRDPAYGPEEDA